MSGQSRQVTFRPNQQQTRSGATRQPTMTAMGAGQTRPATHLAAPSIGAMDPPKTRPAQSVHASRAVDVGQQIERSSAHPSRAMVVAQQPRSTYREMQQTQTRGAMGQTQQSRSGQTVRPSTQQGALQTVRPSAQQTAQQTIRPSSSQQTVQQTVRPSAQQSVRQSFFPSNQPPAARATAQSGQLTRQTNSGQLAPAAPASSSSRVRVDVTIKTTKITYSFDGERR